MSEQVAPTSKKRPSISDVALEAGVSKAAVSKVIRNAYGVSPAMRQRVETAIDQLAYRPRVAARAMRGASFTIGFEVPHLGNDFFTQVTEGAASTLSGSGYQLIVAPGLGYLSGTSVLDALVDRQVDGVIAVSSDVDAQWLEQLATHIPVVLLGRHVVSQNYDTVTDNDDRGTDLVIDHLLELGHRRITHLTIDPPTAVAPQAVRLAAYRRRMEALGREPRVVFTDPDAPGSRQPAERDLCRQRHPGDRRAARGRRMWTDRPGGFGGGVRQHQPRPASPHLADHCGSVRGDDGSDCGRPVDGTHSRWQDHTETPSD
jgi:LacI family transcriptional regulator